MSTIPMSKQKELLRTFHEWTRYACRVVYHIGAWQKRMQWYDPERAPWPTLPADFVKATSNVIDVVTEYSSHEIVSFQRVRDAAISCVADKKIDELNPYTEIHLELRIAEMTMEFVAFSLLAEDEFSSGTFGSQHLLNFYIQYGIHIRDRAFELVRTWPAESEARWRFSHAVLPRYTKDATKTPLALCMNEAFLNGERAELSPMLKALQSGIDEFLMLFRNQRQGNYMPDSSLLDDALNALLPYLRSFRETRATLAEASKAISRMGRLAYSGHFEMTVPDPNMKPSHQKAKALYEWAMENIAGAENMTYAQIHKALTEDSRCEGDGLPDNSEAFQRYCRAAGIRRNSPVESRKQTSRSIRKASQL